MSLPGDGNGDVKNSVNLPELGNGNVETPVNLPGARSDGMVLGMEMSSGYTEGMKAVCPSECALGSAVPKIQVTGNVMAAFPTGDATGAMLSRGDDSWDKGNWKLHPSVVIELQRIWGGQNGFTIDLFATAENRQFERFCSDKTPVGVQGSLGNAFRFRPWTEEHLWVNPPWTEIENVLEYIRLDGAEAVLIAPVFMNQLWYRKVLDMLSDYPVILKHSPHLFCKDGNTETGYYGPPRWDYTAAWRISGSRHSKVWKQFRSNLAEAWTRSPKAGPRGLRMPHPYEVAGIVNGMKVPFRKMLEVPKDAAIHSHPPPFTPPSNVHYVSSAPTTTVSTKKKRSAQSLRGSERGRPRTPSDALSAPILVGNCSADLIELAYPTPGMELECLVETLSPTPSRPSVGPQPVQLCEEMFECESGENLVMVSEKLKTSERVSAQVMDVVNVVTMKTAEHSVAQVMEQENGELNLGELINGEQENGERVGSLPTENPPGPDNSPVIRNALSLATSRDSQEGTPACTRLINPSLNTTHLSTCVRPFWSEEIVGDEGDLVTEMGNDVTPQGVSPNHLFLAAAPGVPLLETVDPLLHTRTRLVDRVPLQILRRPESYRSPLDGLSPTELKAWDLRAQDYQAARKRIMGAEDPHFAAMIARFKKGEDVGWPAGKKYFGTRDNAAWVLNAIATADYTPPQPPDPPPPVMKTITADPYSDVDHESNWSSPKSLDLVEPRYTILQAHASIHGVTMPDTCYDCGADINVITFRFFKVLKEKYPNIASWRHRTIVKGIGATIALGHCYLAVTPGINGGSTKLLRFTIVKESPRPILLGIPTWHKFGINIDMDAKTMSYVVCQDPKKRELTPLKFLVTDSTQRFELPPPSSSCSQTTSFHPSWQVHYRPG